ncbi:hypothetical protein Sango_2061200 [Sesamum angolense]|uniref:DC1 domain-containing protein n=1 Tax=Sesamum angolense TaxID=2727404 RepID=A0AAE1WAS7_9LAMI|nr:hypothetical protein Sango_2061200 [Sesamum angolense]
MTRNSSMKSQTSLTMKRSSSMVEFPTSPQPAVGEQITHYAHSQHPLMELTLPELFTCSGCKEFGAGKRFACQQCDFQLHEFCAVSPPLLKNHPLHGQHQLVFHSKPRPAKGGISWPRCDVCGKSTKGFTFRCRACSFQMHPCCAMLSTEINFPIHPHPLKLLPAFNTSSGANMGVNCGECNKRRSGRMYRCTVCEYHLHAVCAKPLINGLGPNGIPTPEKPSALGTAARLASQVVIEFIGGLIEGFGEGMGEVIVQSIARGRCISRRRIRE